MSGHGGALPHRHRSLTILLFAALALSLPFVTGAQEITRVELQNFDTFLDNNPSIAASLEANPSLANNSAFLAAHLALQTFLNTHPGVRAELLENPQLFLRREAAFEGFGRELTRAQLRSFDNFLDANPAIEKALQNNPSLVNNASFLAAHPALQTFLNNHPELQEELAKNPKLVMNRLAAFERSGGDISKADLRSYKTFLKNNPAIARALKQNPSLVNNPTFIAQHPALQQFLAAHPALAAEFLENPRLFPGSGRIFEAHDVEGHEPGGHMEGHEPGGHLGPGAMGGGHGQWARALKPSEHRKKIQQRADRFSPAFPHHPATNSIF